MASPYLTNAGTFLISTLFGLYILVVMLRFLFQLFRADFYNPISQAIVKITNPPLRLLRRWIPGIGGIDTPSIILMLVLKVAELWLISLFVGQSPSIVGLIVGAVAGLLHLAVNVFVFSIIIQIVLSWIAPQSHNPATSLLYSLTEPILRPARRLIPPVAGLDFSPLVVLVVLQLISITFIAWLHMVGRTLA